MKRKILALTLICILLSLICGCTRGTPQYLPGESEEDFGFVWVCKEPFGFFFPTNNYEDFWETLNAYNKRQEEEGITNLFYPIEKDGFCWGLLKGYIEKEGEFVCFYSEFTPCDQRTNFWEQKNWGDPSKDDAFNGHADYCENYFELEIYYDHVNFFDGELPTLRFDKMAREDFLKQYGDIENVPELLE